MNKCVFLLVGYVMRYVQSAPTDSEIVWLKDVTSSFETDKRTVSDPYLPNELIFHLSRGSHALILNLKRNHGIDPNADIYIVRNLKNGQSLQDKTQTLEKEAAAYYQDRENGAFMTVRCVKKGNEQCERVINGNIRIGDRNYDLRPAPTNVTSRNLLDVSDLLGTQYVLHAQATIQRNMSVEKKEKDKKDTVKQVYWVEIAVLIDSGVWDLFVSLVQTNAVQEEEVQAQRKIREAYSHVINGVHLLYNEIEDSSIEISVTLRKFYIFQAKKDFPHRRSFVKTIGRKGYIEVNKYAADIAYWDTAFGSKSGTDYDHAMLFTKYDLYSGTALSNNEITGFSEEGGICDPGKRISVIEASDYFFTVNTAAHELGHNLGAVHDGEKDAISCPSEDSFIMSKSTPQFYKDEPYSRNPWMFSNCSVEAFKKTLTNKTCVTNKGGFFNDEEWTEFVMKLPGEVYTLDEQCEFILGPKSVSCNDVSADICLFMECTDPERGECMPEVFIAAEGSRCGENMWCKEGRCVSKASK